MTPNYLMNDCEPNPDFALEETELDKREPDHELIESSDETEDQYE
jgi:hypothetical protein